MGVLQTVWTGIDEPQRNAVLSYLRAVELLAAGLGAVRPSTVPPASAFTSDTSATDVGRWETWYERETTTRVLPPLSALGTTVDAGDSPAQWSALFVMARGRTGTPQTVINFLSTATVVWQDIRAVFRDTPATDTFAARAEAALQRWWFAKLRDATSWADRSTTTTPGTTPAGTRRPTRGIMDQFNDLPPLAKLALIYFGAKALGK